MEGQSGDCPDGHVTRRLQLIRLPAAMEGQSGDCPDQETAVTCGHSSSAAMEGQSGDCPDSAVTAS